MKVDNKMISNTRLKHLSICSLCVIYFGDQSAHANNTSKLFSVDEPISAVLTAPLTTLYREKKKNIRGSQEGTFSFKDAKGNTVKLPIKLKTRGNFRRANCKLPPLRLNFKKKANKENLFRSQDKLKLVGPCEKGIKYQQYVGLEFLAYKIFEELSPIHFKTRLLELNYLDSDGKGQPHSATTFVIEDEKHVAKRHKASRIKTNSVKRAQMELRHTALVEVFQYFLGNTDYSTLIAPGTNSCCHNIKLLDKTNGKKIGLLPVPYDFDSTGFVNPPYATPSGNYPIKKVTERFFTGWCKGDQHFLSAIQIFKDKREKIYSLVQMSPLISQYSKTRTSRFIDKFYSVLDDPKRTEREILARCRGKRT